MSRFRRSSIIGLLMSLCSPLLWNSQTQSAQAQSRAYSVSYIRANGYPTIAVVEGQGIRESYVLGCPALQNLWSVVYSQGRKTTKVATVNLRRYTDTKKRYPVVADLPCDGSVQSYLPVGESAALVIKHRDGKFYRHYVDDTEWMKAIRAKSPISITPEELKQIAPDRGLDLRTVIKAAGAVNP
ncbi:hypothetical protein K9N68_25745 [Kovacikia minuta CCNUW1]|uniref:hypothetical protein n=1 Tax=Kovacikia minuta TaxID=2931930 RepID=UPI001CCE47E5|nr:hypothetical protein [Kovacikia minuta]UBF25012.1 hypothetical protein K9N68_25745 [Kovacikia minuta CCNUW1]